MKRASDDTYYLTPQAEGWVAWRGSQSLHAATTLGEAAAKLPVGVAFQFALPCYPLIMERLRLPATEQSELEGMVQLQWEKSLPFSPEEIVGGFLVLETEEGSANLWSVAVPESALEEFSHPWRAVNRWPKRVVPHVSYVAAACPTGETVLVLYSEPGHWVLAVVEDRRPGWVHVLRGMDAAQFAADFPSLLLTAGLEGVNKPIVRVLVAAETAGCTDSFGEALGVPVERLPQVTPVGDVTINLLPPAWRAASQQHRGRAAWRRRLVAAGVVYLAVILAAALHLVWLQRQAAEIETALRAERPNLATMQARESRSKALEQAIDPRRYTIELLFLLQRCLPAENVQFTEFEQVAEQWRVVGEAPSAALAIDYLAKLKHDPDLSANQITADPPRLLTNDRAQFQVMGKP